MYVRKISTQLAKLPLVIENAGKCGERSDASLQLSHETLLEKMCYRWLGMTWNTYRIFLSQLSLSKQNVSSLSAGPARHLVLWSKYIFYLPRPIRSLLVGLSSIEWIHFGAYKKDRNLTKTASTATHGHLLDRSCHCYAHRRPWRWQ